jgi:hypothetical protein
MIALQIRGVKQKKKHRETKLVIYICSYLNTICTTNKVGTIVAKIRFTIL